MIEDQIFEGVDKIKGLISRIKGASVLIKNLQDEALAAIGQEAEKEVSDKLAKIIVQANKDCAQAKRLLNELKEYQGNERIRNNMHAVTLHNLVGAVREYQTAQITYRTELKNKATRQIYIVKPDATEDQIETIIGGSGVGSVYRGAILQTDPIVQAYLEVTDKLQDVLKLEKSVEELHKMFIDMAVLVEHQGNFLNSIEMHIVTSKDHMVKGNEELKLALKTRKIVRRRMCCFCICLVTISCIILGPILGTRV